MRDGKLATIGAKKAKRAAARAGTPVAGLNYHRRLPQGSATLWPHRRGRSRSRRHPGPFPHLIRVLATQRRHQRYFGHDKPMILVDDRAAPLVLLAALFRMISILLGLGHRGPFLLPAQASILTAVVGSQHRSSETSRPLRARQSRLNCSETAPGSQSRTPQRAFTFAVPFWTDASYLAHMRFEVSVVASARGRQKFHLRSCRSAHKKRPRCVGGAKKTLPIDFDVNAGTPFSPNLHLWFPDTPSFLDGYVRFTDGLADRHVRRQGAVFAAKRADTVSITYFCGARGQRKKGRACQRSRDSQSMSCSHSEISMTFSTYVNASVGMVFRGPSHHVVSPIG